MSDTTRLLYAILVVLPFVVVAVLPFVLLGFMGVARLLDRELDLTRRVVRPPRRKTAADLGLKLVRGGRYKEGKKT